MKLGVLLSGGKDSVLAASIASKYHELACAITIVSENDESYMFHVPNISLTKLQAESMQIPLIQKITKGEKEKELKDLRAAILQAKQEQGIEGVVTGAVGSQYQAARVQQICMELDLHVFNPLWQMDQIELLQTLLQNNMEVIIAGVFAYPFQESWLGRKIDVQAIEELKELQSKYEINPAGEGGEIETLVLDCPLFTKKISIKNSYTTYENYAGTYMVNDAELIEKTQENTFYIKKVSNHPQPQITIINTIKDPLHQFEFLRPLTDILDEQNITYNITPISNPQIRAHNIIISGTALKDNAFLEYKSNIAQLDEQRVLAICAGMQLFVQEYLENISEIGPQLTESEIFPKYNYFLHQFGLSKAPKDWQILATTEKGIAAIQKNNIIGMQFHPEVSAKEFIRNFLKE